MKIAIILSGHLRSYGNTFPSFQKLKILLQSLGEVDVFCHTWDIEESISASWWKENSGQGLPEANVNNKEVYDLYQPTAIRIEPTKSFPEPFLNIQSRIPVSSLLSMLYSQYAAYLLMEEHCRQKNIHYDLVIKTRYDLEYEIADAFIENLKNANNRSLFVPNSNSFELTGACADVFAAGDHHSISEYLKFYERFDEVLDHYQKLNYKALVPELSLRTYLDMFNIPKSETQGIRLTILRVNGDRLTINSDIHFDGNVPNCFFQDMIVISRNILSENPAQIADTAKEVVLKYLGWINVGASGSELNDYVKFYEGKWIGLKKIKELIRNSYQKKTLTRKVIRSFFEQALLSAQYGWPKKILFATAISRTGEYGLTFFKILGKTIKTSKKHN